MTSYKAEALENWPKMGNIRALLPIEAQKIETFTIADGVNLYLILGTGKITIVFKNFAAKVYWTAESGIIPILNKTYQVRGVATTREEAMAYLDAFKV